MKIKPEHYAHMKAAIQGISSNIPDMRVAIASDPRVKDTEKRLRWDCSYKAGLTPYICKNIYSYADGSHIDTALRQIMREII